MRTSGWASVVLLGLTACVRHIYPINEKSRTYEPGSYERGDDRRSPGSLFADGGGLFEDSRARAVGDILTIRISERQDGNREASTRTSRESELSLGVPAFFAAMQKLAEANPGLDPSKLLATTSSEDFEGGGSTRRSGRIEATLPVFIKQRLPNGDFFVEGDKVLLLNEEETHLYVSGVVRPLDIEPDNSIPSDRLADVELEYTGRGVLAERSSPGWLSRILDYVWPF
ncbi:MAG: flagellar basal body L-ring protein FlgH [Deltaproteobacteria bacterium]|nr:flagellar basal body L-ring protein FlgH [Deltaproteobacteria bacterium]